MKKYKGNFTIEVSYILPLLLFCICAVIELGIMLHQEVRIWVETQSEEKPLDMVKAMYHREYVKELFGEFYED